MPRLFTWGVLLLGLMLFNGVFAPRILANPSNYTIFDRRVPTGGLTPQAALSNKIVGSFRPGYYEYSSTIYRVSDASIYPLVTVTTGNRSVMWPLPPCAAPVSGADAHLVVMDDATQTSYEVYDANWNANCTRLDVGIFQSFAYGGSGVTDDPSKRVTSAGFAVSAGMVTRNDIAGPGRLFIDHALTMSLHFNAVADSLYVAPAVCGENNANAGSNGIPMGRWYAMPRTFNAYELPVHPFAQELLRAVQEYGVYVNDTSGAQAYKGQYVGSIRIEPGLIEDVYGVTNGDDFLNQIRNEVYEVVQTYGLYVVNASSPVRRGSASQCDNSMTGGPLTNSNSGAPRDVLEPGAPLCADADGSLSASVRADVPADVNLGVNCRVIAENGQYVRSAAEVGVASLVEQGVLQAVDVFSPSGMSAAGSEVCLAGQGRVYFLDAAAAPRVPIMLSPSKVVDGFTCVVLPASGMVVLTN